MKTYLIYYLSNIRSSRCDTWRTAVYNYAMSIFRDEAVALDEHGRLPHSRVSVGIVALLAWAAEPLLLVLAPRVLYQPGAILLALPPQRRGHGLVANLVGSSGNLAQFGRLLDRITLRNGNCKRVNLFVYFYLFIYSFKQNCLSNPFSRRSLWLVHRVCPRRT